MPHFEPLLSFFQKTTLKRHFHQKGRNACISSGGRFDHIQDKLITVSKQFVLKVYSCAMRLISVYK